MLNHAACDVYSPKAVGALIQGQCYGYCFLYLCVKYIFFWFYRSIGFKGNNKYARKVITLAMECADIAAFTFTSWQIRSCLLCKFISPGASLLVFQVVFVLLDKRSELLSSYWSEFRDQKEN